MLRHNIEGNQPAAASTTEAGDTRAKLGYSETPSMRGQVSPRVCISTTKKYAAERVPSMGVFANGAAGPDYGRRSR